MGQHPGDAVFAGCPDHHGKSNLGLVRISTDVGLEGHAFLGSAYYPADMDAGALIRILKPILMGRGSDIPVAVILIGAIGGLILHGLLGLFVGAVVFSIGHVLISEWISHGEAAAPPGAPGNDR